MAALPDNVTYGTVIGRFLVDGPGDEDVPGSGKVRFLARPSRLRNLESVPPTTIALDPLVYNVDDDGYLIDDNGNREVELVATDNASIAPVNWTWRVTISLRGEATSTIDFFLPGGTTVDLATVIPIKSAAGSAAVLVVGPPGQTGPAGPAGPQGPAGADGDGGGDLTDLTIDTGEEFRIVMFSDGTTRAIPADATAPGTPTGLARTVRINSVKLTWDATPTATSYRIYRDGSFLATSSSANYRDSNVTVSSTYTYAVMAVNTYSLRSGLSGTVSAFVDPALNVAPTIEVTCWPTTIAVGNRAIVRVNAVDADAQLLALTLGTDVGSLVATADPSVWILEPV